MTKSYDQAYFDRWYRDPRHRVRTTATLRRKVTLAVAVAEQLLERPVRTVLDVGCGEGAWQPHVARLCPGARYLGVDASDYAVARFGPSRGVVKGSVGTLASLELDGLWDLVVASDVLHYVPDAELERGTGVLASLVGGVAYLETLTADDDVAGDVDGFLRRPAAYYREVFTRAGLVPVGMQCWVAEPMLDRLVALERLAP